MHWLFEDSTRSDTSHRAVNSYHVLEGELETLGEDMDETTASLVLVSSSETWREKKGWSTVFSETACTIVWGG